MILPPGEVIDHMPTRCRSCREPFAGDDPDRCARLPRKTLSLLKCPRNTLEAQWCFIRLYNQTQRYRP